MKLILNNLQIHLNEEVLENAYVIIQDGTINEIGQHLAYDSEVKEAKVVHFPNNYSLRALGILKLEEPADFLVHDNQGFKYARVLNSEILFSYEE